MAARAQSRNLFGWGKKKPKAKAREKRRPLAWLTDKKETYRRDVKGERADLIREAQQKRAALEREKRDTAAYRRDVLQQEKREAAAQEKQEQAAAKQEQRAAAAQEKQHVAAMRQTQLEIQEDYAHGLGARARQQGKQPHPVNITTVAAVKYFGRDRANLIARKAYARGYRGDQNPHKNWGYGVFAQKQTSPFLSSDQVAFSRTAAEAKKLAAEHNDALRAAGTFYHTDAVHYTVRKALRAAGNPCANIRKGKVSDRAKRYRANQPGCKPAGAKKCKLCGSKSDLMVDHVDGDEANGRKSNLRWLCRSCNTTLGAEMARTGQGRRTVQYNPAHKGAQTLGEYMQAVLQHTRGAHDAGGKIIHDTPKAKRRQFASEIWAAREAHGTARPGSSSAGHDEPDWVTNPAPGGSSAHFRAGYSWLLAKRRSSKGSFLTTPGADQYLKKHGFEGTLAISPPYANDSVRQRVQLAQTMREEFLAGADAAWNDLLAKQHSNPLHGKTGAQMSDYDTREDEDRQAFEYGWRMGQEDAFRGRPESRSLGIGTRGHVSPRALKSFKRAYSEAYRAARATPASESVNPSYYSLRIFDGVSPLGGKQEFSAPTLQVAQERAQSYADDMGYDAVLFDTSGKSLGRYKTQRAIYDGSRHEGPKPNPPDLYSAIKPGSRVTIVNRFGQQSTGKAVMRGPHGWVLNMGGRHGTPAIASPENVIRVSGGGTRAEFIAAGNPENPENPLPHPRYAETAYEAGAETARMYKRTNIRPDRNSFLTNFKAWLHQHKRMIQPAPGARRVDASKSPEHLEQFTAGFRSEAPPHWSNGRNPLPKPKYGQPGGLREYQVQAVERAYSSLRKQRGDSRQTTLANPEDDGAEDYQQAQRIAELFHGRAVKEEITVTEQIQEHDWLWRIGPLVSLKVKTVTKRKATFPFYQDETRMVHLFCSPDGRQFYLRGGDQEIDLAALGMGPKTEWFRDHMILGEATQITYRDKKKFHSFKLIDYYHKLGEVTKKKPALAYNALSKKLEIIGGQYKIETEDLVDGMSPGIVN